MYAIHGLGDLSVEGGLLGANSRQHEGKEVRGGLLGRLHRVKHVNINVHTELHHIGSTKCAIQTIAIVTGVHAST